MIIRIGDITANCPECGATDFERLSPAPLRLASEFKCVGCGATFKYLVLLDAIGEEALRRANKAIDALKKRPGRPKK
jgi:transposase-like protein